MNKQKKRKNLILFVLNLFVILIGITYAYYINHIGEDKLTNIEVKSNTLDKLTFDPGDGIELIANQDNFFNGGSNLEVTTIASVNLIANNNTGNAVETYQVYFDIIINEYNYTTVQGIPEIILTITDPTGSNITSIPGLNYVTNNGISGFDITMKSGVIPIRENYNINSTNSITGVTQNWLFKLTYINLPTNQNLNSNKSLIANVVMSKSNFSSERLNLYNKGNEYLDVTGGWEGYIFWQHVDPYDANNIALSFFWNKENNALNFGDNGDVSGMVSSYGDAAFSSQKAIDFSNYSKLVIIYEITEVYLNSSPFGPHSCAFKVFVSPVRNAITTETNKTYIFTKSITSNLPLTISVIDISGINNLQYLAFASADGYQWDDTQHIIIHSVQLQK